MSRTRRPCAINAGRLRQILHQLAGTLCHQIRLEMQSVRSYIGRRSTEAPLADVNVGMTLTFSHFSHPFLSFLPIQ